MSSGVAGILIVFVVAGAVLGARAWFDGYRRTQTRRLWRSSCESAGLVLDADTDLPHAHGVVDGHAVHAWVDELRSRGLTTAFVRVRVDLGDVPPMFIRRRVPESDPHTWHELQTGDPRFDEAVRVSAPATAPVRAWLSPDRRSALMTLATREDTWAIGDGVIGLSQRGLTSSATGFAQQLTGLVQTARALST